MKTFKVLISSLLILLFLNGKLFSQKNDTTISKRKDKNEIKQRCKLAKKEGWSPDFEIGTCEYQNNEIIKLQEENKIREGKGQEDKWIIETFDATSKGGEQTKGISQDKARDDARSQLGKNLGSKFEGLIESGHHYTTTSGEDITPELKEATGYFNEVFDKELKKNKLVARFEKQIKQGGELYWDIKVTIALNFDSFTTDLMSLSKKEIEDRIETVKKDFNNMKDKK